MQLSPWTEKVPVRWGGEGGQWSDDGGDGGGGQGRAGRWEAGLGGGEKNRGQMQQTDRHRKRLSVLA